MVWKAGVLALGGALFVAGAGGALAHEEGKAEQILRSGKILFASKTNNEHIFTVLYNERIWACNVKTVGNWVGEDVGGVVCYSNGVDAEKFETLDHPAHD